MEYQHQEQQQRENEAPAEAGVAGADGAGAPEVELNDDASLFVGDVPRSVTEEQLREYFGKCGGEVVSVQIKKDKVTQVSLGYAFVHFKTREQASEAKRALHKSVFNGRTLRVGWAEKNTNLFVGDLDSSITTEQLRDAFKVFGPLVEEETFVKQRNYGFVKFRNRSDAERAKREMDGKVLGGRPIRIGWGESSAQKHCVHIQFNAEEAENLTEAELRKSFEPFGEITLINLPRNQGGPLKGYAFVYYEDSDEGEDSASRAIQEMNNNAVAGVTVRCNFGKKQTTGGKHPGHQGSHGGGKRMGSSGGSSYGRPSGYGQGGNWQQQQHGGSGGYQRGGYSRPQGDRYHHRDGGSSGGRQYNQSSSSSYSHSRSGGSGYSDGGYGGGQSQYSSSQSYGGPRGRPQYYQQHSGGGSSNSYSSYGRRNSEL